MLVIDYSTAQNPQSLLEKYPDARHVSPGKRSLLNVSEHFEDKHNAVDGVLQVSSAIAIGMFDGVHLGHKAVIQKAIDYAKQNHIQSGVITLSKHPRELTSEKAPELLTDLKQRLILFERMGLDLVLVIDFNQELMNTSAEDYLNKYLKDFLRAQFISTGYDHHFGKNREGNIQFLEKWSEKNSIRLNIEKEFRIEGETVSSSKIRELIKNGEIEKANKFLGHDFFILSKVIHGDKRGSKLGLPTTNLEITEKMIIPKTGVYAGYCKVKNIEYNCAINVGYRPSFDSGENKLTIEAHILDFDQEIYGQEIELYFKKRLRDEKKFASENELIEQIKLDSVIASEVKQSSHNLPFSV